jgi:hypothetical protein
MNVEVSTTATLSPAEGCDVTIVQHEWGLFRAEDLHCFCEQSSTPVVIFAHSGGVESLAATADGTIAMHRGIVALIEGPTLVIPHPAWIPRELQDRRQLRERFGLGDRSFVVGSSGFISGFRQFPEILSRLLPVIRDADGCVELMSSRCGGPWCSEWERIEPELDQLRQEYPKHFRYEGGFLSHEELNLRLQACDLLWCFTNRASSAYASGVAADHYASGTMMVLADVEQHRDIIKRRGTVAAPADLHGFVETLLTTIRDRRFQRHDPEAYSWLTASHDIIEFLRKLIPTLRNTQSD